MKTGSSRPLNFFADENFSTRLVELLRTYDDEGSTLTALTEILPAGSPDLDWIAAASKLRPKPTILGGDGRILRKPAQLAALKDAGLHFVYFSEGFVNLPWRELAIKGLRVWPSICRAVRAEQEPTVFLVRIKSLKVEPLRKLKDCVCREAKNTKANAKSQSRSA